MLCNNCNAPLQNNAVFCSNCGSPININKSPFTLVSRIRLLIPIVIFIVCVFWSLYSAFFIPMWDLPVFGKYSDDSKEIKILYEEAEYDLNKLKEEYKEERQYYTQKERIDAQKFFREAESFIDHPTLFYNLKFFSEHKQQIDNSEEMITNLRRQALYAIQFFFLSAVSIFFIIHNAIKKNHFSLLSLAMPIFFCYMYSGIFIAGLCVLSGFSLYKTIKNQKTGQKA